ncbi:hypothetical protein ACFE04_017703 [Oxalis oulophora]
MPQSRLTTNPRRTHPLVWCVAVICTFISIAVIITGVAIFFVYIVIHPRVPVISVIGAHLDDIQYDGSGLLEIQMSIRMLARNDNLKAHASFSDTDFFVFFNGLKIGDLRNKPFSVQKNFSVAFDYHLVSSPIPLDSEQRDVVYMSLNNDHIKFELKGKSRARWRVSILGSIKFELHLNCALDFHVSNHSYIPSKCTSNAK